MRPALFTILLLWSTALLAQGPFFAPAAPLTNTRYGAIAGEPLLATNGTEAFLFTATARNVRMTPLASVERLARPVLDATDADVAWNGTRFFVAGTSGNAIAGRLLDDGAPFTVIENASKPRLALPLMLFDRDGVQSVLLNADGVAFGEPVAIAPRAHDFDVATNGTEIFAVIANDDGVKLLTLTAAGSVAAETRLADAATRVSIASDGRDFLALWLTGEAIEAAVVRAGGVVEPPFAIADAPATAASLLWDDGRYRAAFVADDTLQLLDVNPAARSARPVSLAIQGAFEQSLADTASTPNAALVVWTEGENAHAGIRGMHGTWRERIVAAGESAVAAASDGRELIVIVERDDGWSALLLDESGALLRRSPRIASFRARDVAFSAGGAVVIGTDENHNIVAARVLRDGSVAGPVALRGGAEDPVIASDGTSFLAAWQTLALTIEATRLGSNLEWLDTADIVVFDTQAEDPAVAFNGSAYVVAWRGGSYVRGRRVTREGVPVREFAQIGRVDGAPPRNLHLTSLGDGKVAFTWLDGRAQLLLLDGWDVLAAKGFATRGETARVVALPLGGAGFVGEDVLDDAPHYGASRIVMSIAHPTLPAAPDAPRITVAQTLGRLHVGWTPPAQPVSGYRVEYRVEGGAWMEAEGWSDAASRSQIIDPGRAGLYELRVRAFSDSGTSAYSEAVAITVAGRRRAVR